MRKKLRKRIDGFSGKTHFALSLVIMEFCLIVSIYPPITSKILSSLFLLIVCTISLAGGALLVDLDNDESTAKYSSGLLGLMMTLFMKSTSSMVWNIYHFKGDRKPPTQHRYLWHAPIIGISMILLFYFGIPTGDYNIFTNMRNSADGMISEFIKNNAILVLFILLIFLAILVGSSMIYRNLTKVVHLPPILKYILPIFSLIYVFTTTYTNLRIIGVCLGFGYLLHCLEDMFCDSSIPLIFPIPAIWKNKVWWKPHLPFTVTTGSTINGIIDIISGILAFVLFFVVLAVR